MLFDPLVKDPFEAAARAPSARSRPLPADMDFADWPLDELLAMPSAIEAVLPVKSLKDMDLARELVLQVQSLQQLQQTVAADNDTPVNQKAQVANSLSSALVNLVKLQNDVYTAERFKKIEAFVIQFLNTMATPELRAEALSRYEALFAAATGE